MDSPKEFLNALVHCSVVPPAGAVSTHHRILRLLGGRCPGRRCGCILVVGRHLGAARDPQARPCTGRQIVSQTKRPPEGGLSAALIGAGDQATRKACRRRYVIAAMPAKPRIIMAQVLGSGTALNTMLPAKKPFCVSSCSVGSENLEVPFCSSPTKLIRESTEKPLAL